LELSRSPSASECKDESQFAEELRARMSVTHASQGLLLLRVSIDRDEQAFIATIHVDGRQQGVRTLRANGPSCEALHDALIVALLLLLDEDPSRPPSEAAPSPPPAAPTTPDLPPAPAPLKPGASIAISPRDSAILPLWLSAGGAITSGLPEGFSFALWAEAFTRVQRFDFGIAGFWAPEKTVPVVLNGVTHIGDINVRLAGARARGCYAIVATDAARLDGCGWAVVSALRGEGKGTLNGATGDRSASRSWILLGAGPDLHLALTGRIGLGISGSLLLSPKRPSFYIATTVVPPPSQYESPPVAAWGGLDVRVRIW
jgi:hypothetical protein